MQLELLAVMVKKNVFINFPLHYSMSITALKKQSGILYQTNTQLDLNNFIKDGAVDDFALVVPYNLLTRDNIELLATTGKVTGLIVLLNNPIEASSFSSPDSSCPNCEFGLYAKEAEQYVWNPQAQNLIEESFEFPIFAILPEDSLSQSVYNAIMKVTVYIQIGKKPNTKMKWGIECQI